MISQNDTPKTFTLYVLLLETGKYYVGITSQTVEARFREHLGGRKSYWTEKYPPVKIVDQKPLPGLNLEEAQVFENTVVRRYIKQKGIANVRGGDITNKNDLVVRFNRIIETNTYESILVIVFQSFVILYLMLTSIRH